MSQMVVEFVLHYGRTRKIDTCLQDEPFIGFSSNPHLTITNTMAYQYPAIRTYR